MISFHFIHTFLLVWLTQRSSLFLIFIYHVIIFHLSCNKKWIVCPLWATVRYKPRLYLSVNLLAGVYSRHLAQPLCRHSLRHVYAPMSNIASHDNHKKIISWVSYCFSKWAWLHLAPKLHYDHESMGCESQACQNRWHNNLVFSFISKLCIPHKMSGSCNG